MSKEPESGVKLWWVILGAVAMVSIPPLLAVAAKAVAMSTDSHACVIEIASYWPEEQHWRTARVYGDGRLEVRDTVTKNQADAMKQFSLQLTAEEIAEIWREVVSSGLFEFSNERAASKERATGRARPLFSEPAPTDFTISSIDEASSERAERVAKFHLTYGGAEHLAYPEIAEYAAANRLSIRLLSAKAPACDGCAQ